MKAIINDAAVSCIFYDEQELLLKLDEFLNVCILLKNRAHNIDDDRKICVVCGTFGGEACRGKTWKAFIKDIDDKDKRNLLASFIIDSSYIVDETEKHYYISDKICRAASVATGSDILISIASDEIFEKDSLTISAQSDELEEIVNNYEIDNVWNEEQCLNHKLKLGIRVYRPNAMKHHPEAAVYKDNRVFISPMPLTDAIAQKVLETAISVDDSATAMSRNVRLVAKYKDKYYMFPGSDNVFHGFEISKEELIGRFGKKLIERLG